MRCVCMWHACMLACMQYVYIWKYRHWQSLAKEPPYPPEMQSPGSRFREHLLPGQK